MGYKADGLFHRMGLTGGLGKSGSRPPEPRDQVRETPPPAPRSRASMLTQGAEMIQDRRASTAIRNGIKPRRVIS